MSLLSLLFMLASFADHCYGFDPDILTGKQTDRQTGRHTYRLTDIQTVRQADRSTANIFNPHRPGWLALLITVVALVLTYPQCRPAQDREWWQKAVIYRVYVRSFLDTQRGDGIGDLEGECVDGWVCKRVSK